MNTAGPNLDSVVPVEKALGESDAETKAIQTQRTEAEDYVMSFPWCREVKRSYYGCGIPGIFSVFLLQIQPAQAGIDEWLWVIVGDLPSAYLVTDEAPDPQSALKIYVAEMSRWVSAAKRAKDVSELIPVNVSPTRKNARMLEKRLAFITREYLPLLHHGEN